MGDDGLGKPHQARRHLDSRDRPSAEPKPVGAFPAFGALTDPRPTPPMIGGDTRGAARLPRWEERLLGSSLGPLYRVIVNVCARSLLIYYAHAPAGFPKSWIWQHIGYRYVFGRRYTTIVRTSFGAEMECSMKDLIQRHIMFFGVWEPNLTAFLQRRLSAGDVFIDLGANVGYFTLLASQLVGETGAVVAIEAAPHIFRRLQENLIRNNVANARTVEAAVAATPGTADLYSGDPGNLGATTMVASCGYERVAQVAADQIDRLVTAKEFSRARLIKIDIEGAEMPPLMALLELVPVLRDDVEIIVELSSHSLLEAGNSVAEIVGTFEQAGFHAYDLQNSYSITDYFQRQSPIAPRRIRTPIGEQTDVVFSRHDLELL